MQTNQFCSLVEDHYLSSEYDRLMPENFAPLCDTLIYLKLQYTSQNQFI